MKDKYRNNSSFYIKITIVFILFGIWTSAHALRKSNIFENVSKFAQVQTEMLMNGNHPLLQIKDITNENDKKKKLVSKEYQRNNFSIGPNSVFEYNMLYEVSIDKGSLNEANILDILKKYPKLGISYKIFLIKDSNVNSLRDKKEELLVPEKGDFIIMDSLDPEQDNLPTVEIHDEIKNQYIDYSLFNVDIECKIKNTNINSEKNYQKYYDQKKLCSNSNLNIDKINEIKITFSQEFSFDNDVQSDGTNKIDFLESLLEKYRQYQTNKSISNVARRDYSQNKLGILINYTLINENGTQTIENMGGKIIPPEINKTSQMPKYNNSSSENKVPLRLKYNTIKVDNVSQNTNSN